MSHLIPIGPSLLTCIRYLEKSSAMDSFLPRSLVCHCNLTTVTAALVNSLLGSFTSTQLMSQARGARTLPGVLIWTRLSCLIFGFCGTWYLHFLGILSCEFDVPIGLDSVLTALSALVAVSFTFIALSSNLRQQYRQRLARKRRAHRMSQEFGDPLYLDLEIGQSSQRLLRPPLEGPDTPIRKQVQLDGSVSLEVSDSESLLADIEAAHLISPRRQSSNGEDDLAYQMMFPVEKESVSDYDDAPKPMNGNLGCHSKTAIQLKQLFDANGEAVKHTQMSIRQQAILSTSLRKACSEASQRPMESKALCGPSHSRTCIVWA